MMRRMAKKRRRRRTGEKRKAKSVCNYKSHVNSKDAIKTLSTNRLLIVLDQKQAPNASTPLLSSNRISKSFRVRRGSIHQQMGGKIPGQIGYIPTS